MEEKLPNNATPDQMNKDSTTNSTVIPTSQRFVEEDGENGEKPSQIELDL